MLIDIKKLLTGREEHAAGEFEADLSGESFPAGFSLKAPVRIAYDARRQGDGARLELDILCQAVIQCDRCLEQVERTYHYTPDYLLFEGDWTGEDPELPFTSAGKLDLKELGYDEILLNLPSSLLCRPDCQGLCPVCGKPVSAGCSCRQNVGDDRLSILKQLLS